MTTSTVITNSGKGKGASTAHYQMKTQNRTVTKLFFNRQSNLFKVFDLNLKNLKSRRLWSYREFSKFR